VVVSWIHIVRWRQRQTQYSTAGADCCNSACEGGSGSSGRLWGEGGSGWRGRLCEEGGSGLSRDDRLLRISADRHHVVGSVGDGMTYLVPRNDTFPSLDGGWRALSTVTLPRSAPCGQPSADSSVVRAAFESSWSSLQVEGQIDRLKFLKRQMYGCANLKLLRARTCIQTDVFRPSHEARKNQHRSASRKRRLACHIPWRKRNRARCKRNPIKNGKIKIPTATIRNHK
jgi:hypothetical protein